MKTLSLIITILFFANCKAENRIKVAVIDTGISREMAKKNFICKGGLLDFTQTHPYDTNGHGTNIVEIISENINPKTHCIVSLKFYLSTSSGSKNLSNSLNALRAVAEDYSIKYLNLSLGGPEPDIIERNILRSILARGVIVTAAAGNERDNLDGKEKYYPASYRETLKYKNFYVVKSRLYSSNYGSVVTDTYEGCNRKSYLSDVTIKPLCGTSQASAQKMSDILKSLVLYRTGDINGKKRR